MLSLVSLTGAGLDNRRSVRGPTSGGRGAMGHGALLVVPSEDL